MTKLTKIKNLIAAPGDAAAYEIVPSVGAINASSDGTVTTGAISIGVYKTTGGHRSTITPGIIQSIDGAGDLYRVQYSIDGGTWTECVKISLSIGSHSAMGYGIAGSAVATVKSTLSLRLQEKQDGSYSTVYQMAPLQVVKNGAQGQRGRWYYFDGYYDETKEYQATDAKAPYVAFDWEESVTQNGVTSKVTRTSYYMLVALTNKRADNTLIAPRTQSAGGVWELMEDSFKYMITEAMFSAFAKLGSAVFSGDWMISQYGNGGTDRSYQSFKPFGESGWHPNIGIDFLNGEMFAGNGKIHFAKDGGGVLAGGNISWDGEGNVGIAGFRMNKMRHITQSNFGEVMTVDDWGDLRPQFEKLGTMVTIDYLPEDVVMSLPSDNDSIRKYYGEEFVLYNKSGKGFGITGRIVEDETKTTTHSYNIPHNWFGVFRPYLRVIDGAEDACWLMRARGSFKPI